LISVTPDSERTALLSPNERGVARRRVLPRVVGIRLPVPFASIGFRTHILPAAIVLLPVVLTTLVFWPGHMSADTLDEAFQASTGKINNQHPALLIWGWHLLWPLGVGPGWLLFGQVLTFVVGMYLILRAAFKPIPAAVVAALIQLSPPIFGITGWVGRDMWFLAFLTLTFGLLVRTIQRSWPARGWWLAATVLCSWLTLAARPNAASAVIVVLVPAAAMLLDRRSRRFAARRRLVRGALYFGAGLALTLALMLTQTALGLAIGVKVGHPEQYTMIYDLSALSTTQHKDLFPASVVPPSKLGSLEQNFNVDDVVSETYVTGAPVPVPLKGSRFTAVRKSWISQVTGHPFGYLKMRGRLFLRQIGVTRRPIWIFHPGIDANSFGYQARFPSLDDAADDYVEAFAHPNLDGTFIHRAWIYLIFAVIGVAALLHRRRAPALMAVGGLALAAPLIQVGYFFGAMGTQYRFEHGPIAFCLITLAVLLQLAVTRLRRRRQAI
jgi:hypothetical protein